MKKSNTAKNYFIIWIISIVLFVLELFVASKFSSVDSHSTIIFIVIITVVVGVAAFILMIIKFLLSMFSYKKDYGFSNQIEELVLGPEKSGFVMHNKKQSKSKIADLINNDIDDVIFKPKERKTFGKTILFVIFILISIFFLSSLTFNNSSDNLVNTNNENQNLTVDYKNFLDLENWDINSTATGYFFSGTLKNSSPQYHLSNIIIRLDFTRDEAGLDKFDTRYIEIEVVPRSGAITFNEPLGINPPVKNWWYIWQIETADGWEQD